jgi:hypothetical protein
VNRDGSYTQILARLALAYPGEHKGAQAAARALMADPEALRGAHAVANLVVGFHGTMLNEGLTERNAGIRAIAMLTLIENVVGNLIDDDTAHRFMNDYERAAESLRDPEAS